MSPTVIISLLLLLLRTSVATPPTLQRCADHDLDPNEKYLELPATVMSSGETTNFRLKDKCATRLPHCIRPCQTPLVTLPVQFTTTQHQSNNNDSAESGGLVVQFTPYGYFRYDSQYFSQEDICIQSVSNEQMVLKVCPQTCPSHSNEHGLTVLCIPKCCSIHKALDIRSDSCEFTNVSTPWSPPVYRSSESLCRVQQSSLKLNYVQSVPPECKFFHKYLLRSVHGSTRVQFRILTSGTMLLRDVGGREWKELPSHSYCMDGVIDLGVYTQETMLLVCQDDDDADQMNIVGIDDENRMTITGLAYVVLLFTGVPFLLITAVIYVLVWNSQNVHGWTIFSHTLAMLLHYLAQAVANTVSRIFDSSHSTTTVCFMVGVLNHFFVLASFCWLTVINYDLFSMFRNLKTTVGRSRGMKRFAVYMTLAWGLPFLAVLISVVLDNLYGLYGDENQCAWNVVVPLYGHRTCYIAEEARVYYLYYPVGLLMGLNMLLALLTFRNMYFHDKDTATVSSSSSLSSRSKHRGKFSVMAKLFVVMGFVWLFELCVWSFKKPHETLPWYLVFPDVFNVLQAVAIFKLFACQDKLLGIVDSEYPRLRWFTRLLRKVSCDNCKNEPIRNNSTTTTTIISGKKLQEQKNGSTTKQMREQEDS